MVNKAVAERPAKLPYFGAWPGRGQNRLGGWLHNGLPLVACWRPLVPPYMGAGGLGYGGRVGCQEWRGWGRLYGVGTAVYGGVWWCLACFEPDKGFKV